MGKATVVAANFRFKADVSGTSWIETENIDPTIDLSVRTTFRVRIMALETAGGTVNLASNLYASFNGGAYFDVTTASSYIRAYASSFITDDASLTTRELSGSGTWADGRFDTDGVVNTAVALSNSETEFEFACELQAGDLADGNTIALRLRDSATELTSYTYTPTITVSVPAAAPRRISITHL